MAVILPSLRPGVLVGQRAEEGSHEPALRNGVGPRVEVHGLGVIANHPYSAPCEDLKIRE